MPSVGDAERKCSTLPFLTELSISGGEMGKSSGISIHCSEVGPWEWEKMRMLASQVQRRQLPSLCGAA